MVVIITMSFGVVSKEYTIKDGGITKTVVVSGKELRIYEAAEGIYKKRRAKRVKIYNRNIDIIAETYDRCIRTANNHFRSNGQAFYASVINRCVSKNRKASRNNVFIEPNFMDIVNEIKRINGFTDKPVFDPGLNDPTIGDAGCDDPDY